MDQNRIDRIVRFAAGVGLAALAACFIWLIASRSAEPRAYFEHRRGVVGQWEYPIASVLVSCALLLAEAAILRMVLARPKVALWKKSLVAFGSRIPRGFDRYRDADALAAVLWPYRMTLAADFITLCLLALCLLSGIARLSSAILEPVSARCPTRRCSGPGPRLRSEPGR